MCHLMASDKLEEQIPKLIPAILSLYKKNNENYVISKVGTVCSVSEVDCLVMDFVTWIICVNKQTITLRPSLNCFLAFN